MKHEKRKKEEGRPNFLVFKSDLVPLLWHFVP